MKELCRDFPLWVREDPGKMKKVLKELMSDEHYLKTLALQMLIMNFKTFDWDSISNLKRDFCEAFGDGEHSYLNSIEDHMGYGFFFFQKSLSLNFLKNSHPHLSIKSSIWFQPFQRGENSEKIKDSHDKSI